MKFSHLPHPKKCFCQFSENEIQHWFIERFIKNIPTVELLKSVQSSGDRDAIVAVGLLDVDDDTLLEMMGDVDFPDHHILHCREQAKKIAKLNA